MAIPENRVEHHGACGMVFSGMTTRAGYLRIAARGSAISATLMLDPKTSSVHRQKRKDNLAILRYVNENRLRVKRGRGKNE
jgi:hypothetical protein